MIQLKVKIRGRTFQERGVHEEAVWEKTTKLCPVETNRKASFTGRFVRTLAMNMLPNCI